MLAWVGLAFAEQDQGMVAGRVTDARGGVLTGAIVTATSATGAATHTSTNAEGHYVLAPLIAGTYQVTIEHLVSSERPVS